MNKKEFVFVVIVTCLVVLIWVIAEIIHAKPSEPIDPKIQKLLDPINPNFDQATLNQLKNLGIKRPEESR
ncbi:hypothetical protein HYS97_02135 [Candidatus Daviesbacteria bacterium]|nr:hypothetical protein [Candidatus Daviesbacteria bacterium]